MPTLEEINIAQNDIKRAIEVALRSFRGQVINDRVEFSIRNTVIDIIAPYYENGFLDSMPLVDVNHRTELSVLGQHIMDLKKELDQAGADVDFINQQVVTFMKRFTMLRDSVRSNDIHISLKDPETLQPYIWPLRGKYDH